VTQDDDKMKNAILNVVIGSPSVFQTFDGVWVGKIEGLVVLRGGTDQAEFIRISRMDGLGYFCRSSCLYILCRVHDSTP